MTFQAAHVFRASLPDLYFKGITSVKLHHAEEGNSLAQKLSNILASLDRCEEFSQSCDAENDQYEITLRLGNLDKLWSLFEDTQTDIECSEESLRGESQNMVTREKFESKFFRVKGRCCRRFQMGVLSNRHQLRRKHPVHRISPGSSYLPLCFRNSTETITNG